MRDSPVPNVCDCVVPVRASPRASRREPLSVLLLALHCRGVVPDAAHDHYPHLSQQRSCTPLVAILRWLRRLHRDLDHPGAVARHRAVTSGRGALIHRLRKLVGEGVQAASVGNVAHLQW